MSAEMFGCCGNAGVSKEALAWVAQVSTLIVAVVGFITAVIIAKFNHGLEIEKAICLKKIEAYENALRQLRTMITIIENIRVALAAICKDTDNACIRGEVAQILAMMQQYSEAQKRNDDIANVELYVNLPSIAFAEVKASAQEVPRFILVLEKLATMWQTSASEDVVISVIHELKEGSDHMIVLFGNESTHFNRLYDTLIADLQRDKRIKKLLKRK